jgi:glycosyltransferase involved in cell wall biosynthesis
MRIGLIAPPWIPVPPPSYGGTEGVVDTLARGLRQAGQDPVVFTTGDASCAQSRLWVYDRPATPIGLTVPEMRHVQAAYDALGDCDVIHDHTILGPVWAGACGVRIPVVTTCHGPFTPQVRPLYADIARWATVTAISQNQRDSAPEIPVTTVIHHGLDPSAFAVGPGDGGYLLFLGRLAPEKGAHAAIEIARAAGVPLRIAAKMREPEERAYFQRWVEPALGPDVEYLGEIGPEQRCAEIGGAMALLNPIAWPEPFGLVMIEALACGTPVIACASGAAPEIVEHGVTGYVCEGIEDAVRAVHLVPEIDRQACRRAVETRFSAQRMVADYLALYRHMLYGTRVVVA